MSESHIPTPEGQSIPSAENLLKAVFLVAATLASFFGGQLGADYLANAVPVPWIAFALKWTFLALVAVWNCILLTGMGILAHDAVHRVLFRSPFWNELGGGLLSALALLPFYANRQFHLTHHSYAHQPGLDPENEMHDHPFPYAATVGSVIALYLQYRNLFRNLLRIREPRRIARAVKDILLLSAAGSLYFILVPALGLSLAHTVVPMLLALLPVFAWRALSDHYGIPPLESAATRQEVFDADPGNREAEDARPRHEVSGWVVLTSPWLEWLWSHVNYHEVHHKYPYLSHQYLPQAFEASRNQYPYLVVDGYWRSLLNVRKLDYYAKQEDVRTFMTMQKP